MTSLTPRIPVRLIGLALGAIVLAFPTAVAANTNEPIAQTGGMTATLPLLGTSLKVDVTLDAVGKISGVALDPTGTVSKTEASDHAVKFSNAGGTAKVVVRAQGDKLTIAAKAKLGALVGSGTWAADVFGTGVKSTVAYTIGKDGSGSPTLAIGAVSTPSGVTPLVNAPATKTHDKQVSVSGGVTFSQNGFSKRLTISINADKGTGAAKLRITLSGRDRQTLTGILAALAGNRTWAAHLCNGTAVSVKFHVTADGKVVYDSASGAPATEKNRDNGFVVRFTGTSAGVSAFLKANGDGTYTLVVRGQSGHCGKNGQKVDRGHHGDQFRFGGGDRSGRGHQGQGRP